MARAAPRFSLSFEPLTLSAASAVFHAASSRAKEPGSLLSPRQTPPLNFRMPALSPPPPPPLYRLLQKGRDVDAEKILHRIYAPKKLKSGGCTCAAANLEMARPAGRICIDLLAPRL